MGNGALAIGPKLPRPSSTLPERTSTSEHRLDDRFHETSIGEANQRGTEGILVDSSFEDLNEERQHGNMATWRQALEVVMTDEEVARLLTVSRSRTEPASRVQRAQMLLAYRGNPSFFAVGQRVGVHHQTVQRCIERALAYGR